MQRAYTISRITPVQVDPAYLLAGSFLPVLEIDRWRRHCGALLDGATAGNRRDVVVAVNSRGYLQGLSVHAVANHAVHGCILDAPIFAVASAADEIGVAGALFRQLCMTAGRQDCAAIRIRTGAAEPWHRKLVNCPMAECRYRVPVILDATPFPDLAWLEPQDDGLPVKT
ncbi:hypothetical protein ASE63_06520 [Bosea sp. Root381]|uniref:hypothetical protein n=1 Tax=Bosea sp. Root381 TaxID=1736524 RepID=UPI0006FEBEFB|nr:hypothetical protein [Bosea sp. Root381]KRE05958.1 hypothetical protein ASE63_06520 [Bosea sp. Root381]